MLVLWFIGGAFAITCEEYRGMRDVDVPGHVILDTALASGSGGTREGAIRTIEACFGDKPEPSYWDEPSPAVVVPVVAAPAPAPLPSAPPPSPPGACGCGTGGDVGVAAMLAALAVLRHAPRRR